MPGQHGDQRRSQVEGVDCHNAIGRLLAPRVIAIVGRTPGQDGGADVGQPVGVVAPVGVLRIGIRLAAVIEQVAAPVPEAKRSEIVVPGVRLAIDAGQAIGSIAPLGVLRIGVDCDNGVGERLRVAGAVAHLVAPVGVLGIGTLEALAAKAGCISHVMGGQLFRM